MRNKFRPTFRRIELSTRSISIPILPLPPLRPQPHTLPPPPPSSRCRLFAPSLTSCRRRLISLHHHCEGRNGALPCASLLSERESERASNGEVDQSKWKIPKPNRDCELQNCASVSKLIVTKELHSLQRPWMDSDDNHPSNEDNTTPSSTDPKCKKRKGRGATRLPDVIKDRRTGMRKVIKYDHMGRPTGTNRAKFASYLGVLARTMIPLSHTYWSEVTDDVKERLWETVSATFDVDLRSKKGVLSSIATCLRTFRKYLTKHIYANKSNPIILSKPPEAYSFLEQQEWDSFVKRRLTKEFEEFRGVQQSRRKRNLYDHRLSRKGYSGLEEEIANKSEETVVSVDRSVSWKKARQNKNGEYGDIKTKEKAMEIDEIAKQVEDGTLQTQGSNDILTMALDGSERSCVRGVGGKVTPTIYFHVPRRGNHSRCEEKQNSLLQIVSQMQVQLDAIAQHMPHTPKSDNIGSNTFRSDNLGSPQVNNFAMDNWGRTKEDMSPPNPTPKVKKGKQCKLAVGSINNIVALGTAYEKAVPNEEVHMVPLEESNLPVSIDVVKVGEAFLPIPIPEGLHSVGAATVGEAVGFHVAWPKSLILFAPEVGSKKPGMFGDEAMPKNQDCRNNLELPNINKSQQCRLAVGSVNNIVALGTMFWKSGPNELLHTVPLGEDHMRVSIDVVKVKDALLPIPISEEVATVGDAVGCFVAWPKDLIFFAPEVASKKPSMVGNEAVYKKPRMTGNKNALKHHGVVGRKVVGDEVTSKNVERESNLECIELFTTLTKHTDKMEAFQIPIDDGIFGTEVYAQLQKVDMEYICHMKEVSATCIMLYIRQLYLGIKVSNMDTRFAFVNPCSLSENYKTSEASKPGMLASRLEDVKNDQLLLVPCNIGVLWVLCVVELSSSTVYYMDSINKEVHSPLKLLIKTAFKIYDSSKGVRSSRIINWKTVECPKQPTNVECGFYVMKYMKDLIRDERILSRGNFNGKKTYTKAEIDEVRAEWIKSVMNEI